MNTGNTACTRITPSAPHTDARAVLLAGWRSVTGGQGCSDFAPGHRCPGQSDIEYVSEFSLWVIVASPLIFATDPRNMSAIQRTAFFNSELLAVHQDALGMAGGRVGFAECDDGPNCQIWARPVSDGAYAVALYNAGNVSHDIALDLADVDANWQGHDIALVTRARASSIVHSVGLTRALCGRLCLCVCSAICGLTRIWVCSKTLSSARPSPRTACVWCAPHPSTSGTAIALLPSRVLSSGRRGSGNEWLRPIPSDCTDRGRRRSSELSIFVVCVGLCM
jgi:hypothetical protein